MAMNIEFASKIESFKTGLAGPFIIFDSETHIANKTTKVKITHDKTMKSLKASGFDAYPMLRFNKEQIRAAIVYGVSESQANQLINMSQFMGNEYCVYGTGKEIRKILHRGKSCGSYQLADIPNFYLIRPDMPCFSLPYNSAHFSLRFFGPIFTAEEK